LVCPLPLPLVMLDAVMMIVLPWTKGAQDIEGVVR
jgi:hypothetical protein